MTLWILLACAGDKADTAPDDSAAPDSPADDSAAPDDTGDAAGPPLQPEPAWTSQDRGYGTGLGFADLDADGDADVVIAYGNDMSPGPLAVYLNDGGALPETASWTSAAEHYFGHLSVGDVDGDGQVDVVVSRYLSDLGWDEGGGVQLYRNVGGQLEPSPSWEAEGFYSFANALGDVDGDGDLDLVATAGESYSHIDEPTRLFLNDGAGDFGDEPVWQGPSGYAYDAAFADLDADGRLDLALARHGEGHAVWLNQGGTYDEAPSWQATDGEFEGNTLDWGDIDGDGALDLVVSDNNQLGGDGVLRAWCGPALSLCWTSQDRPAMQSAVSLEDVDGDGDLDLAAGAWWGAARIYENQGGALSAEPVWVASPDDPVVEAFDWEDLDLSHAVEAEITGEGLVQIPGRGRVLSVEGGCASGGWASGPGELTVRYLAGGARDLAVSNWDPAMGNYVYGR